MQSQNMSTIFCFRRTQSLWFQHKFYPKFAYRMEEGKEELCDVVCFTIILQLDS